jgi:hypothetical protein
MGLVCEVGSVFGLNQQFSFHFWCEWVQRLDYWSGLGWV